MLVMNTEKSVMNLCQEFEAFASYESCIDSSLASQSRI